MTTASSRSTSAQSLAPTSPIMTRAAPVTLPRAASGGVAAPPSAGAASPPSRLSSHALDDLLTSCVSFAGNDDLLATAQSERATAAGWGSGSEGSLPRSTPAHPGSSSEGDEGASAVGRRTFSRSHSASAQHSDSGSQDSVAAAAGGHRLGSLLLAPVRAAWSFLWGNEPASPSASP